MSSGVNDSTRCSGAPVPMFPPAITRRRPDESTSSMSVVVVVLPFVPVTPTIGARQAREAFAELLRGLAVAHRDRRPACDEEPGKTGGGAPLAKTHDRHAPAAELVGRDLRVEGDGHPGLPPRAAPPA